MNNGLVVFVTVGREEEGIRISEALVSERLAACVNIVPGISSIYAWEGKLCRDSEVLLIIKTTEAAFAAVEARVRQLHTYSVPEIIALKIDRGSDHYLAWLAQSATPKADA